MIRKPWLLAAGLVVTSAAALSTLMPPILPEVPYRQARQTLLQAGWSPVPRRPGRECGSDRRCSHYPETDICLPTGTGVCRMVFRSYRKEHLVVLIAGGFNAASEPAVISGWFLEDPAALEP